MKTILTESINKLQKYYGKLKTILIIILTIGGFLTPFIFNHNNAITTIISAAEFIIRIGAILILGAAILIVIDERMENIKFNEKSLKTFLFVITIVLSFIYIVLLLFTHLIFPIGVVAWGLGIYLIFVSFKTINEKIIHKK